MRAHVNGSAGPTGTSASALVDPPDDGVDATVAFRTVDLSGLLDSTALSDPGEPGVGGFNVWRNTYPADQLPPPGSLVEVAGVPFRMPTASADGDNVRCRGQVVPTPPGPVDWIHVLAASERRTEDDVAVHFADGHVDVEPVRVSDFWSAAPWFGEHEAFRTPTMHYPRHVQQGVPASLWAQRVPVTRRGEVVAVRLPRTIALHVFAMTLVTVRLAPATGGAA